VSTQDSNALPDREARALRLRNLRTIGALAALFLLPLAASFYLYYGIGWHPAGTTLHGELIDPARPLLEVPLDTAAGQRAPRDLLKQHWTLVYLGAGGCDEDCRAALYVMRQTRLSLANDMSRVHRVFLATGECCNLAFLAREHAGLEVLDASGPAAEPLLAQFPQAERAHMLFVVDPLGNLMMRYDTRRPPRGLLQDLKKLLQLSHIG